MVTGTSSGSARFSSFLTIGNVLSFRAIRTGPKFLAKVFCLAWLVAWSVWPHRRRP